jgi:SsrA-binding protein
LLLRTRETYSNALAARMRSFLFCGGRFVKLRSTFSFQFAPGRTIGYILGLFEWRLLTVPKLTLLSMTTDKVVATNREAYHNFHILETHECGVALTGTEVKSAREGRCNLKDGYAQIRKQEAWLMNVHISPYAHGNRENHEPTRARKLLLHRSEIDKLAGKVQEKGLTLVPTKMYLKNGRLKIELAVAKGKKLYDKRETEKRREADREARAMLKERSR